LFSEATTKGLSQRFLRVQPCALASTAQGVHSLDSQADQPRKVAHCLRSTLSPNLVGAALLDLLLFGQVFEHQRSVPAKNRLQKRVFQKKLILETAGKVQRAAHDGSYCCW